MIIEIPRIDEIRIEDWMKPETHVLDYLQIEFKSLIENHIWVTAKRQQISVNKMTSSHISNCINCLNGNSRTKIPNGYLGGKVKWLNIFNNELNRRQ